MTFSHLTVLKTLRTPIKTALAKLPWGFYLLLAVCVSGLVYSSYALLQSTWTRFALQHPDTILLTDSTPPILIFAKAQQLSQHGDAGQAVQLYASLYNTPDTALRMRALHNAATLYLQEAAQAWNQYGVLDAVHVGTQVELAKDSYRASLRLNPDNADAQYNLEYAYRITPPPRERAKANFQGTKASVFSTLPGLPSGGP